MATVVVAALAGSGSAARAASKPASQLEFGVQMAQRGLWSEALFRFERARAESPRDPRVLNNLAVAYEAVGRFDDALAAYRAALEVAPEQRRLRQNYTRFVEFYQAFRPAEAEPAKAEPVEAEPPEAAPATAGGETPTEPPVEAQP